MLPIVAGGAFSTLVLLLGILLQGYFFPADPAWRQLHMLAGLVAGIFALVVHSAVMTYFIGTGRAVKEAVQGLPEAPELILPTRRFKGLVFPFAFFSMLFVIAAAVLGAGVGADLVSKGAHGLLACVAAALNMLSFPIELRYIARNALLLQVVDHVVTKSKDGRLPPEVEQHSRPQV